MHFHAATEAWAILCERLGVEYMEFFFFVCPKALLLVYKDSITFQSLNKKVNAAYDGWLNAHFTASYPQIGFTSYRYDIALEDSR